VASLSATTKTYEALNSHAGRSHGAVDGSARLRPWNGIWHLRQGVPQDHILLRGQFVTLSIGNRFVAAKVEEVIQVSLRTDDQQEAKERHAVADSPYVV
jgi:hypothetical protein